MKRFINQLLALMVVFPAFGMTRSASRAPSVETEAIFAKSLAQAELQSQPMVVVQKRKYESVPLDFNKRMYIPILAATIAQPIVQPALSPSSSSSSSSSSSASPRTIFGQRSVWQLPAYDDSLVTHIMNTYGVGLHVAHTLIARGYTTDESINQLTLGLSEKDVPNASLLKHAEKAVTRILKAISKKEKILVCGDYDVDGMTSSALLVRCISDLGGRIDFKVPHRVKDGYGLKVETIEKAARNGFSVVITVDNGITAFEPARRAQELGIDLIITDHHLAHNGLPDAYAIVNPNQPECSYPNKGLAGVGVAFKLMMLLYEKKQLPLPDKAYELMMLGTIADVVPLTAENRYWVRRGLELVNSGGASAAFQKLYANAKLEKPRLTSIDIAFNLTPQLNAIGRLDDANEGVKFLLENNSDDVHRIGDVLSELNTERKKVQSSIFDAVKKRIQDHEVNLRDDRVIMLSSPDWHPGVNGLVASKVVERYYKPTLIFQEIINDQGEVILKGSGRSTRHFDLFKALDSCKDLLITFGGHMCAAGVSLKKENFQIFKERMQKVFFQRVPRFNTVNRHQIDSEASFDDLTQDLIQDFQALEPFGSDNPQPTLLFNDVRVAAKPTFMGRKHVKCLLKSGDTQRAVKFFFRPDMFYRLQEMSDKPFKLIGHPDDNHWKGQQSIEINGVDIERTIS